MNPNPHNHFTPWEEVQTIRDLMEETGAVNDPFVQLEWAQATSPLANGAPAAAARVKLLNKLMARALSRKLEEAARPVGADVPARAVILGYTVRGGVPVRIHVDVLTAHLLAIGMTGCGKTSYLIWLLLQLAALGIRINFHDHKGEGRRLCRPLPHTMVFRPDQEVLNPLEPVGPWEMYWIALFAELGRALNLHVETYSEGPAFMRRLARELKPGQPFPSWRDLAARLRQVAKVERRPKLATLAGAVEALCGILGAAADVRSGPQVERRYSATIREFQQLPPRIHRFLTAVRLLRKQMQAMSLGHTSELREVHVSDEAVLEFGHEAAASGATTIPVHQRIITQNRSFGLGVLAGGQLLSVFDDYVRSNVRTVACFRLPNPDEARAAQRMLLLPESAIPQIMTLPTGTLWVRSADFPRAVLVSFPKVELGDYPSDAEMSQRLAAEFAWLEQHTHRTPARAAEAPLPPLEDDAAEPPASSPIPTPSDATFAFLAEHRAFLRELLAHPAASVTEHYRNLNWSSGRGNRVKTDLLARRLIVSTRDKTAPGRPIEMLALTPKGKELLNEHQ